MITLSILASKFLFPSWEKETLDEFFDAFGMGVVLFGFLIRIAARGYKAAESFDGKTLIKDGLYGLVRHPMYFGTLLIGTGVVFVLFEWWALLLFIIVYLLIYIPQIRKEEKEFYRVFGDEYKNYCKVTPQYFPGLFNLLKINLGGHLFFKWPWVKKELPSLILTVILIMAIETWEDVRLFGGSELKNEILELSLIIAFCAGIFSLFYRKNAFSTKN